jgi:hypothetical protein
MALALSVRKDGDDYVLVEHAGERMRIGIHDHSGGDATQAVVILLADNDSGRAPDQGWRLLRKVVREREDEPD